MINETEDPILHEKLRALPGIQAPADLIPGVLHRIAAQGSLPWWRCPWLEWPRLAQAISGAFLAALVGGICYWRSGLWTTVKGWAGDIPGVSNFCHETWIIVQTTGNVFEQILASTHFSWAVAVGVVAGAYLTVVGIGAAFCHVLFGERQVSE